MSFWPPRSGKKGKKTIKTASIQDFKTENNLQSLFLFF
jgi:hypothetical protein